MIILRVRCILVAVALVHGASLTACDADQPSTRSSTVDCDSPADSVCRGYADYAVRCDGATLAERDADYADCVGDIGGAPYSCEFARGTVDCLDTLDCSTSDDKCIFAGFMATDPAGWNLPLIRDCVSGAVTDDATCDSAIGGDVRACIDRLEECIGGPYEGATNAPFTDDRCFSMTALQSDAASTAMQCLGLSCDAIADCLDAAGTFNY